MFPNLDALFLMVLVSGNSVGGTALADVIEAVVGGAEEDLGGVPSREDVEGAADQADIHRRLLAEPFSFSEVQATYLTSMPIRAFSEESRVELEQEARRLRAEVGGPGRTEAS